MAKANPNLGFNKLSIYYYIYLLYIFQGNSGLKAKEGEVTSQPWQWPITYRVNMVRL